MDRKNKIISLIGSSITFLAGTLLAIWGSEFDTTEDGGYIGFQLADDFAHVISVLKVAVSAIGVLITVVSSAVGLKGKSKDEKKVTILWTYLAFLVPKGQIFP